MTKYWKNFFILTTIAGICFVFFPETTQALSVKNPIGTADFPGQFMGNIIKAILGLTGMLSLVFFVWGGMLWMTAGGNDERVKQGKDTMLWATLGLTAIFLSYVVLKVVIETLASGTMVK